MDVEKIEFNSAGFRELLTSAGPVLDEHAETIAGKANADGDHYEVTDGSDNNRARRRIVTKDHAARVHEAKTQALQRSI
jgi:hypothetical protein